VNLPTVLRSLRFPIATRVLLASALLIVALTIALLFSAKRTVEQAMYAEIIQRVEVGQNLLRQLAGERGTPALTPSGEPKFGSWTVRGDHSVVDLVKKLTGVDATIFGLRDGVPVMWIVPSESQGPAAPAASVRSIR